MYSICDKYIILFDYFAYIILIKVVGGDMQIYYLKSKSVDYVCEVCGIDSASVVSANNKEYVYIPNTSSGITKICNYPLDVLVSVDKDDNIEIFIQEGKAHGLSTPVFKQIKNSDIDFLIIPDAATNDEQQIKDLLKDGKRVLILDHHIPSDENMKTINNIVFFISKTMHVDEISYIHLLFYFVLFAHILV